MLLRNDLFKWRDDTVRVLAIDDAANLAWLYPMDDTKALPIPVRYSDVSNKTPLRGVNAAAQPRPSATAIRRSTLAWQRIEPLVSDSTIFDRRHRNHLINERAQQLSCSPQTLLKDLRRYWAGGQTTASLMGAFHHCGQASPAGRRRGCKPRYGKHDSFVMTPADRKNMDTVIRRHYLKNATTSVPAAYQRLREQHYSFLDGNQARHLKEPGQKPSLRQFRYYLETNYSLEQRLRGRLGDNEFERNHRARPGYGLQDCLGVGHIYEIDATIADVWIVAAKDRSRIIGKPTLYLVYDKFSRLIVGFYAGLEAPSWPAARHAIISIAEDKAAICQRYGVKYDSADWPATGAFPQTFVGDRGEMLSADSSTLSMNMSITVKNEPSQRPDRKGTVECGFKLIQGSMADSVPGYEPPANVHKRRGKKYDKDASLTLDEFTAVLLNDIIMHNRSMMRSYPLSAEMLSRDLRPVPTELWTDDVKRRTGSLTRFDEKFVRLALLPQDKATVTPEGILFKGCYYTCPEAIERGWFVKAGQHKFAVDIAYDKRLVDAIYVHDAAGQAHHIEATLAQRSADYKGLAFDEVAAYEYLRRSVFHAADEHNAQARSDFHAGIDTITDHARRETRKVATGKSRSSRKKDIAADRIEERRARRQEEAPVSRKAAISEKVAAVVQFPRKPPEQPSSPPSTSSSLKDRLRLKYQEIQNG